MHKHIDGHYAFMDGKSDILIDHCHDLGTAYLRFIPERRAFVKVWPILPDFDMFPESTKALMNIGARLIRKS